MIFTERPPRNISLALENGTNNPLLIPDNVCSGAVLNRSSLIPHNRYVLVYDHKMITNVTSYELKINKQLLYLHLTKLFFLLGQC